MENFKTVDWSAAGAGTFIFHEDYGVLVKIDPVEIFSGDYDGTYDAVQVRTGYCISVDPGEYVVLECTMKATIQ